LWCSSARLAIDSGKGIARSAMAIDSFTVLLFALFVKLLLGALFAAFWIKNRTST
jgi:hypothetical protein